jgi:hypothetical protein
MNGLAYTGVGSRKTPFEVLERMRSLGYALARAGYLLRSGGADGADEAFERGAKDGNGAAEIYVPWPGFNDHPSGLVRRSLEAEAIARSAHPAWDRLSPAARKCHTRNVHQVLGFDLRTPSLFVVCWTPDGCTGADTRTAMTGGTATAILVAERYAVPVFNLQEPDAADRIDAMLGATFNERWRALANEDSVAVA